MYKSKTFNYWCTGNIYENIYGIVGMLQTAKSSVNDLHVCSRNAEERDQEI